MKKNLKFVSAAAAALLTVAPVVATAVTPTATVFADGNNSGDVQANAINVNVNAPASTTVDVSAKVADYLNSSSFPVATSLGTANVSKVTLTQNDAKKTPVPETASFQNGWIYNQSATVQLSGLQAGKWYNVNGKVFQANDQGVEPDNAKVTVTRQLTAINSALPGNPYFTNKQNQVIYSGIVSVKGDGVVVDGALTLDSVLTAAKEYVTFHANSAQNQNGWITTTTADVKAQLENQGIKVTNGSFSAPENGFYVSLTGWNQSNGKTASVKVPFAPSNADYSSYPLITIGTATAQGKNVKGKISTQTVKVGDKTFTGTEGVKAQINAKNTDKLQIFVTSNNVNVNVPGTYSVTLSATNPAGLTTTVTRTVVVTASGLNGTINYVPGYSVNVWNVYGNQVAYANKQLATGSQVKTFDTKTVDGVSYTRINKKDSNEWVQTQYLDGSWNQNSNTSSNSSAQAGKEEAMSGVIVVKYNGLGGVNLLNNKGQYQDQYVKNGSAFKVFGKMTLNGKTYYRLGTQNQWIPAQYAVIR